jgi:hypothetical protein
MSGLPVRVVCAAVLAVALAGCGGGSGDTSQPPSSGDLTTALSSGGHTTEPPASEPPGGTTVTAPDTTPDRLAQACGNGPVCDDFATPSGNIRCFAADQNGGFVECDITSGLNPEPDRGNCDLEQPGLSVGASGTARVSCRSDPTPAGFDDQIPPLSYGDGWSGFGVVCASRVTGITCTNTAGHGFFLSRESWKTF